MTFPLSSAIETIVLLKVEFTKAIPELISLFIFFFFGLVNFFSSAEVSLFSTFFLILFLFSFFVIS